MFSHFFGILTSQIDSLLIYKQSAIYGVDTVVFHHEIGHEK